jgi:hypothetical protein
MTIEFEDDYITDPPVPYEQIDLGRWFDGKEQEKGEGDGAANND